MIGFLEKVDWTLLREQKGDLLEMLSEIEHYGQLAPFSKERASARVDSLNGLLHLIEDLQDLAAKHGYPVFGAGTDRKLAA